MHERPRRHVECVTLDTSQTPCSCPPPGSRTSPVNSTARQPLPTLTLSPPLLLPIPTNHAPFLLPLSSIEPPSSLSRTFSILRGRLMHLFNPLSHFTSPIQCILFLGLHLPNFLFRHLLPTH
ncbi:uncharacterized protein PGTG_18419 [Puccinia graminis f. sp. tritici CRL 75-36-700-3]|uniref:Uncharacterized protein n=1 Tax=Puccinia graminis f. sp. tritici (strain CRL 75-36-700-3 / race SCCL) TaxID=418459 RepID=E3L5Z3_PUCGT|nr:uncharacterized protein PGTG_18419 [Puccinia graminis f. sp. tritici CRL 75-36-700-3]EFP91968.1 hypothetical protein PGTG_18419 [Puccinia graminis f. sp. tritici CRL 75-36-700-3]